MHDDPDPLENKWQSGVTAIFQKIRTSINLAHDLGEAEKVVNKLFNGMLVSYQLASGRADEAIAAHADQVLSTKEGIFTGLAACLQIEDFDPSASVDEMLVELKEGIRELHHTIANLEGALGISDLESIILELLVCPDIELRFRLKELLACIRNEESLVTTLHRIETTPFPRNT